MNWPLLSPEIAVTVLALGVILVDLFFADFCKRGLGYLAAIGVFLVLLWTWCPFSHMPDGGTFVLSDGPVIYQVDAFALFFKRFFLLATIFVLVMSVEFSKQLESGIAEFYALILFALVGMMLVASVA